MVEALDQQSTTLSEVQLLKKTLWDSNFNFFEPLASIRYENQFKCPQYFFGVLLQLKYKTTILFEDEDIAPTYLLLPLG